MYMLRNRFGLGALAALIRTDPLNTGPSTYANRKARLGDTSIADQPHKHERATARRLRQHTRKETGQ